MPKPLTTGQMTAGVQSSSRGFNVTVSIPAHCEKKARAEEIVRYSPKVSDRSSRDAAWRSAWSRSG
jgi:hypothetical protein